MEVTSLKAENKSVTLTEAQKTKRASLRPQEGKCD